MTMSLAIDVAEVSAVLLADGWHAVAETSFAVDSYEFVAWDGPGIDDPVLLHAGGSAGVCAAGFRFRTPDGDEISGPMTSILAVDRAP